MHNPDIYTSLISFNPTLVMVFINVLILYLLMKKFFFEKIRNFMIERENSVKESFDSAELTMKHANDKLEEYNKKIAKVESEGREIIKLSKVKAENQAKRILDESQNEALKLKNRARAEIEQEQEKAVVELQNQIARIAIYAAEKILEKQIDDGEQDAIVKKIIEQAGDGEWQNL